MYNFISMKAAVRTKYGLPGDLAIKDLDIPVPKDDEVLIKVHATTVNRSDCHVLSGKPYFMRLFTGLLKPKKSIIGSDFTGEIAGAGKEVISFIPGNKIMGFGGGLGCGSHAQYFILPAMKANKIIVPMPSNLDYEEAAACLEGAVYATSFIQQLTFHPNQKALVYGATGAIGTAYVQVLKSYGISVTAVCAGEHADLIRTLGADKVIDYKKDDFTKDPEKYDFIFDAVGKTSFLRCRKLLTKQGVFAPSNGVINLLWVVATPLLGGKKVLFPASKSIKDMLNFIRGLVEEGKFKPVIDRKYPLEKIAEAFTYVASGKKIGNVIISMDSNA